MFVPESVESRAPSSARPGKPSERFADNSAELEPAAEPVPQQPAPGLLGLVTLVRTVGLPSSGGL